MSHLTPDQLIDAIDEALTDEARAHLDVCLACQAQLNGLSLAKRAAESLTVPEPSPLFWEHFSARVRSTIDATDDRSAGWSRVMRPWILVPVGAIAVVIAALIVTMPRAVPHAPIELATASGAEALSSDDGWTLVADAVGDIDWDTAAAAGLSVEPGAVDRVVMELTADEQRELRALLQAELRAKS